MIFVIPQQLFAIHLLRDFHKAGQVTFHHLDAIEGLPQLLDRCALPRQKFVQFLHRGLVFLFADHLDGFLELRFQRLADHVLTFFRNLDLHLLHDQFVFDVFGQSVLQLCHQDHLPLLVGELRVVFDHLSDAGKDVIEEDGMSIDERHDTVASERAAAKPLHAGAAERTGRVGSVFGFGCGVRFHRGAHQPAFFFVSGFVDQ